jgi:hypothetical protein
MSDSPGQGESIKIITEEGKQDFQRSSIDLTYTTTSRSTISDSPSAFFRKEVPLWMSVYSIISTYAKACQNYGFLITEQTPTTCTGYHTQRCSLKSLMACCLGKKAKLRVSSVRLIITTNTRIQCRVIYVKGQFGDMKLIGKVLNHYSKMIENDLKQAVQMKYQQVEEEEEEMTVTCKNESYSYYQFYKILSCDKYSLGKSVSEFCEGFICHYRNPKESAQLLPQPLNSIQATVESTVETLFSHYNYGKKNTEKMMIYCRPAVEKYIYTKLHEKLIEIYKAKFEEQDKIIEEKRKVVKNMSQAEIMKELQISDQYLLVDEERPYEDAIEIIGKINELVTPGEKINCIMNFDAALKSCVVQYWKGQLELDIESSISVVMYSLLMSKAQGLYAEIALVNDYLFSKKDEEKGVVEMMEKALLFIAR